MSQALIIVDGHLGRDPELRYTPQGGAVCDFTIGTNYNKKDKSGVYQKVALWYKITLWGKMAENAAKHLAKGRHVLIHGTLGTEEWTDRDGKDRYTLCINATGCVYLGGGQNNGSDGGQQSDYVGDYSGEPATDYTGEPLTDTQIAQNDNLKW